MTRRTLIIYGFETSNNIKVRLALEHFGRGPLAEPMMSLVHARVHREAVA